jgi:hypothetical protein
MKLKKSTLAIIEMMTMMTSGFLLLIIHCSIVVQRVINIASVKSARAMSTWLFHILIN